MDSGNSQAAYLPSTRGFDKLMCLRLNTFVIDMST